MFFKRIYFSEKDDRRFRLNCLKRIRFSDLALAVPRTTRAVSTNMCTDTVILECSSSEGGHLCRCEWMHARTASMRFVDWFWRLRSFTATQVQRSSFGLQSVRSPSCFDFDGCFLCVLLFDSGNVRVRECWGTTSGSGLHGLVWSVCVISLVRAHPISVIQYWITLCLSFGEIIAS